MYVRKQKTNVIFNALIQFNLQTPWLQCSELIFDLRKKKNKNKIIIK